MCTPVCSHMLCKAAGYLQQTCSHTCGRYSGWFERGVVRVWRMQVALKIHQCTHSLLCTLLTFCIYTWGSSVKSRPPKCRHLWSYIDLLRIETWWRQNPRMCERGPSCDGCCFNLFSPCFFFVFLNPSDFESILCHCGFIPTCPQSLWHTASWQ